MDDEVENLDNFESRTVIPAAAAIATNRADDYQDQNPDSGSEDPVKVVKDVAKEVEAPANTSGKEKLVGKFISTHANEKALIAVPADEEKQLSQPRLSREKSSAVEVFKVPDKPPPKKQRVVLEEDQYATDVEKIIQRDFFPDLEKLKAQNAYLSAMQNNDIHMLRELYSKYNLGKRTPRTGQTSALSTPTFFETPLGASEKATPAGSEPGSPTHLPMESPRADNEDAASVSSSKKSKLERSDQSLNSYLDNYTSEDNKSFQDFMDEADRKHRMKFSWLYDAETKHAENMKNAIALPSAEEQAAEYKRPLDIETWEYKNRNYVMYVPDGVPFTVEEKMEQARKKKEIVIANTRFKTTPFKQDATTTSAETPSTQSGKVNLFKSVAGKIGVDGKEIESATPKVNGFSYVRTPSPTPIAEESPFMTWGEIEGTPFRLDGGDTPIPVTPIKPYKILEQSRRDKLGIELAEQVSQRYRDKKLKAIEAARSHLTTPSPRPQTVLERLSSMSPAAQQFAKTRLGSKLTGDKALVQSYTPKRTPSSSSTPTPGKSSSKEKTPSSFRGASGTSKTPSTSTPVFSTDNLLKLPGQSRQDPKLGKRPKASDYF